MKKACSYCGKIHGRNEICIRKSKPQKKSHSRNTDEKIRKFRDSGLWKSTRTKILKRDFYLCQACLNNLTGTLKRINSEELSVHHIVPLAVDFDRKIDSENLITLCNYHHELAENDRIKAKFLIEILKASPRRGDGYL